MNNKITSAPWILAAALQRYDRQRRGISVEQTSEE